MLTREEEKREKADDTLLGARSGLSSSTRKRESKFRRVKFGDVPSCRIRGTKLTNHDGPFR